jgi:hypothetical protein
VGFSLLKIFDGPSQQDCCPQNLTPILSLQDRNLQWTESKDICSNQERKGCIQDITENRLSRLFYAIVLLTQPLTAQFADRQGWPNSFIENLQTKPWRLPNAVPSAQQLRPCSVTSVFRLAGVHL